MTATTIMLQALCCVSIPCRAGDLVVDLGNSQGVTFVGVFNRWDADGNPRTPVNPKARIEAPEVTAKAERAANRWVFRDLPTGRFDLVILTSTNIRVEGFYYPPVAEFDPILPPDAAAPTDARDWIIAEIAKGKHYENKVTALALAGNDHQIRVFVQLLRDEPTSYDAEFGTPVATLRHEVWQYTNRYGGWVKEKKTKILDRILMPKSELQQWTWVWEPKLGKIELADKPRTISYELPTRFDPQTSKGLLPNAAQK